MANKNKTVNHVIHIFKQLTNDKMHINSYTSTEHTDP